METDLEYLKEKVDEAYVKASRWYPSVFLRPSDIAHDCVRFLWLQFRWGYIPDPAPGPKQRIFARGNREEDRIIDDARKGGLTVMDKDPDTGRQYMMELCDGHMRGYMDAVVCDVAGKVTKGFLGWAVLEVKSMASKYWRALDRHGIQKEQPTHYGQIQIGLEAYDLAKAIYWVRNKDTEEDRITLVDRDPHESKRLLERASMLVGARDPVPGISTDPTYYACRTCPASQVCHGIKLPPRNCRTCPRSLPVQGGEWWCERHEKFLSTKDQMAACPDHRYIPGLIHGKAVMGDKNLEFVQYRLNDGSTFMDVGQK